MASSTTAVTVIEQSASDAMVEWNLDEFPVEQFNRLLPTQTLMLPTDLLRPVVQVVKLNPDPKNGGDVYASADMPEGHAAPTRVGLRKLATAAGISFVDERRVDDGRDPDVIEVSCLAEMLMPTGQRIRAVGSKRIDLNAQVWKSPAHRGKYRSFFQEHVASRAQNRAIRALLSLRGSYPAEVYSRPFAVVSFAPNMNHPEVRERILSAMAPALTAGFGPAAGSPPMLAAGAPPVYAAPEAPDEDEAPAAVTVMPGERLRAAAPRAGDEEPSWITGAAASAQPAAQPASLADMIRSSASDEGAPKGKATKPQTDLLARVFAPLGDEAGRTAARGLRVLFGPDSVANLTAAQARAIAIAADSDKDFLSRWQEMAS
jgi:hypothetical protein